MMDGVSVDGHRQQPAAAPDERRVDSEVKVLTSNYQAEYGRSSGLQITAVTKSGTNRFRGSLYDVERNSDWNANCKTNKLNGDPKTVSKERDWGFSIGGPVGKPGGNNKLFFFYSQEFEPRTGGQRRPALPGADARSSGRATSRRRLDNIGNLYHFIKDPRSARARARATEPGRVLRRRRRPRQDSGEQLYQTGLNILKHVPAAERSHERRRSVRPTTIEITRPNEIDPGWQPARPRRLPADAVAAGVVQVLGLGAAQPGHQRLAARLQRHADAAPGGQHPGCFTGQLQPRRRRCSSRAPTATARTSWPAARSRRANTGPSFCTAAIPMNAPSNRGNVGLGRPAAAVPERQHAQPGLLRDRRR